MIGGILGFIALLLAGLLTLTFSAALDAYIDEWFGDNWWSWFGAALGVLLIVGAFVMLAWTALWLWWENTVYLKWNNKQDGAITWLNVWAIISLVLAGGGALSSLGNGEAPSFSGGTDIFGLVLSLLALVFGNMAQSNGELTADPAMPELPN